MRTGLREGKGREKMNKVWSKVVLIEVIYAKANQRENG